MFFVSFSKSQENSTETTKVETPETTTTEPPKIFKISTTGNKCHKYNRIISKDSQGHENIEIECVLKNLDVNSFNRNKFKLDLDETKIAKLLNLEAEFFNYGIQHHKNYITQIKTVNSHVRVIPGKLFVQAPKLKILQMSNSGIKNLFPDTFKSASNLENLQLHYNQLKKLHSFTFMHAAKLQFLDISHNGLENIQSKSFHGLQNLEKLALDNNDISSLNDEVFHPLKNLQEIYLGNNKLTIIPAQLFSSENNQLKKIFLNSNEINEISYFAFDDLPKLRFLNLEQNECVNMVFTNHKITGNSGVQLELKKCVKNFNKIITDDQKTLNEFKYNLKALEGDLWKLKNGDCSWDY